MQACGDWNYKQFCLPAIEKENKLPVVLNGQEVKALLKVCKLLNTGYYRAMLWLRSSLREVRNVHIADADLQRGMLHVRKGKGSKDRCTRWVICFAVVLLNILRAEHPRNYLFEGNDGEGMSQRGTQWVVGEAVKNAGIRKEVHTHTLTP